MIFASHQNFNGDELFGLAANSLRNASSNSITKTNMSDNKHGGYHGLFAHICSNHSLKSCSGTPWLIL